MYLKCKSHGICRGFCNKKKRGKNEKMRKSNLSTYIIPRKYEERKQEIIKIVLSCGNLIQSYSNLPWRQIKKPSPRGEGFKCFDQPAKIKRFLPSLVWWRSYYGAFRQHPAIGRPQNAHCR